MPLLHKLFDPIDNSWTGCRPVDLKAVEHYWDFTGGHRVKILSLDRPAELYSVWQLGKTLWQDSCQKNNYIMLNYIHIFTNIGPCSSPLCSSIVTW